MSLSSRRAISPAELRQRLTSRWRTELALPLAIIVALAAFGIARPGYLAVGNLLDIVQQTAVVSLIGFAMTIVIMVRGIDLSVGSSLSLAGVVGGVVFVHTQGSPVLTILAVLGAAAGVGVFNGVLVSWLRVNAFMVTLGTYAAASGAAISISGGNSVALSGAVVWLGSAKVLAVPASAWLTVIAMLLFRFLLRRTVIGRWFHATGGQRETAAACAIPVRLTEFSAYVISGFMVGVATIVMLGWVHSAQPLAGQGLEFTAITAAVIGGASLQGGRGDVLYTLLGSIFTGVIATGLSFLNVSQSVTYIATGLLVVLAVIVSQEEVPATLRARYAVARVALAKRLRRGDGPTAAAEPDSDAVIRHRLSAEGVRKTFPGVVALKGVDFELQSGEVVALLGENGAGKSTLVKILAGNQQPTSGQVRVDGRPLRLSGPEDARRAGIAVIHQHLTLVPDLTVAENMFLGNELRWGRFGPLRRRRMRRMARAQLREFGVEVPVDARLASLPVGTRQMIEIARALQEQAWLVIMDEPTSALPSRERDRLLGLIETLRRRGTVAILYISHKFDEIYRVAGRAVVLRDGEVVGRPVLAETEEHDLIGMMVGRSIENVFPYRAAELGATVLEVDGVADEDVLRDVSFSVRRGEIVGLVGLMGSGRTELLRCVFGLDPVIAGAIRVQGRDVSGLSTAELVRLGVAFIPEDRHLEGILPDLPVADNLSLLWIRRHSRFGVIPADAERRMVEGVVHDLSVRPPDPRRRAGTLSGGNQQKLVFGKWLTVSPSLVLLDDPTRGVDVGAKAEIHNEIARLKQGGAAVVITSSEAAEVLNVADRIVVLRRGTSVAEYAHGVTEEQVMRDALSTADAAREPQAVSAR